MTIQSTKYPSATVVKIGRSRQVVIPKRLHDALGLTPGDYLDVELKQGKVVMTPKTLVDKPLEEGLAESLADFKAGRVHGPFSGAKDLVESLHRESRKLGRKPRQRS